MCGITGIINTKRHLADTEILRKMTNSLIHRGPDGEGFYVFENVGLGHRRLKIIDLSENAKQPMANEDNSIFITYNGEVYNYPELRRELESGGHKFRSCSDTEIVLHAYEEWGFDCLEHFIGMWAFAIWDKRKRIVFASRDRIGVKPFYYYFNGNILVFSSEIKALLDHPDIERRVNHQSIYEYLYLGYPLDGESWIKGIKQLKPAHYLVLDGENLNIKRYWSPETIINYSLDEMQAAEKLRGLINDSVKLRLRSDVEVCAHLSGGIDSASIVGIASRISQNKLKTFSGIFISGKEIPERNFIRDAVNSFQVDNQSVIINPEKFMQVMPQIIWNMDEPIAGPGVFSQYFLCDLIKKNGIKVALGGQGGDELFGGYPHYYSGILSSFRSSLGRNRKYISPKFLIKLLYSSVRREIGTMLSLRQKRLTKILNKDFLNKIDLSHARSNSGFYKGSLEEMILWDFENYLPALLHVEDRISMAFSIETRLPLLDHRIAEYALRLPGYLKINNFNSKYILREAVKDILPETILKRRSKAGFVPPLKIWLKNNKWNAQIKNSLSRYIETLFVSRNLSWEKINIALWLKIFKISL